MTDTTSYSEEMLTLEASGWRIPAALTLPSSIDGPLASAILLVPGSLFCDVNGDFPAWNSFPHVYAHLAHQFSALGHAVYRFAKLGPGTGSVSVDAEASERGKGWDGRLIIAEAALRAMRAELAARGIEVAGVVAAGHSEGSVVVSRLAVEGADAELDGVVLLSGPSVGILEIMREQMAAMSPNDVDGRRRLDLAVEHVRRGESVPAELGGGQWGAGALASMPPDAQRYMRECDATDPTELAARIRQPVLVVQGGQDTSVPTHHGERLRDTLIARTDGEERTSYLYLPEVTHMYKIVPPDVPPMQAFGYPGETDLRVAEGVDAWVRRAV